MSVMIWGVSIGVSAQCIDNVIELLKRWNLFRYIWYAFHFVACILKHNAWIAGTSEYHRARLSHLEMCSFV